MQYIAPKFTEDSFLFLNGMAQFFKKSILALPIAKNSEN